MSEKSAVTTPIMKIIEQTPGCWGFKVHGDGEQGRGLPDIICCYRGRFIAAECKAPSGGRVMKLQRHELEKIRRAGGTAFTPRDPEEFLGVLATIDREWEAGQGDKRPTAAPQRGREP